jgi:hypothetical protein
MVPGEFDEGPIVQTIFVAVSEILGFRLPRLLEERFLLVERFNESSGLHL